MVAIPSAAPYRAPIWPVIIAPLVGAVYYLAIKAAFAQSIVSVLGNTATTDIDLSDLTAPQWGSHWFYRGVAEVAATGLATFVAAGLAHGRERLAAIVAGCTISLGFIARVAFLLYAWKYMDPADFDAPEPWYQYAIEAAMINRAADHRRRYSGNCGRPASGSRRLMPPKPFEKGCWHGRAKPWKRLCLSAGCA
jgi:hypothetical protein